MDPITFSIITPSYNQGKFLEDAIKSVLIQKGNFYIDYIIMDGGSTDNSVEIIKKYEGLILNRKLAINCKGIKYRWRSEKDEGQADALEKGFALTSGDIGAWLNSDDVYYNDEVFANVSRYFISEDIDLLIGNGTLTDKEGNFIGDYRTEKIDIKELIFLDYHILQPSAFLRLEYFKKNNFDKYLNYTFDVEFFIRLLKKGIKYKKIKEYLSCFRIYPEIKTMSGLEKRYRESLLIANKFSNDKTFLFISRIFKYFSEVIEIKYQRYFLVRLVTQLIRNIAYRLVIGTWGRK